MKELTSIAELLDATTEGKKAVLYFSEKCPACQHFVPAVEEWSADIGEFDFYKISRETYLAERRELFEVGDYPALVVFLDGQRMDVLFGTAPEQAFKAYFDAHITGKWKSRAQIEQEQLEALDN